MRYTKSCGMVAVGCSLVLAVPGFSQGPLSPSSAPAPTMKTLEQVEPRIPISELPFVIYESGSYYVTTNLTGKSGQNGISILATHVTLDLSGFRLVGSNSFNAIAFVDSSISDVVIRNGWIEGWFRAVDAQISQGIVVENIHAVSNGWSGGYATLLLGPASVIRHCTIRKAGTAIMIGAGSRISDCNIYNSSYSGINTAAGCKISDCNIFDAGATGYELGADNTVENCSAMLSLGNGFSTVYSGVQFLHCLAAQNGIDGFRVRTNCTLTECKSSRNGRHGISVESDCRVTRCDAVTNEFQGIDVHGSRNLITDNLCNRNISSGIYVHDDHNRIENNHVVENDYGIYLFEWAGEYAASNVIVRNTAEANRTANYNINGAINFIAGIDTAGAFTNAWANFSF